jgi:hypothetical protein
MFLPIFLRCVDCLRFGRVRQLADQVLSAPDSYREFFAKRQQKGFTFDPSRSHSLVCGLLSYRSRQRQGLSDLFELLFIYPAGYIKKASREGPPGRPKNKKIHGPVPLISLKILRIL